MKKTEPALADYLAGTLSEADHRKLEANLAEHPDIKQEFDELRSVWDSLAALPSQDVPASTDAAFYQMLHAAKQQKRTIVVQPRWPVILRYAAALTGIGLAFWAGRVSVKPVTLLNERVVRVVDTVTIPDRTLASAAVQAPVPPTNKNDPPQVMAEIGQLKREMQQTRALLVLSLLKRESAADRLQALDYSSDITQPDPEVLAALIKTLDIDPNINVRLAAVDALSNFSNEPSVRRAMALSLLKQQEAIVQMSLIDILTKLQDRQAIVQIKHLAENTDTPTQVRERAEESIKLLSL